MSRRNAGTDVRLEIEIAAPPSTVFALLTEAVRLRAIAACRSDARSCALS
jgi:uncharacterized protein YndB with AHSA1/START domain